MKIRPLILAAVSIVALYGCGAPGMQQESSLVKVDKTTAVSIVDQMEKLHDKELFAFIMSHNEQLHAIMVGPETPEKTRLKAITDRLPKGPPE